MLAWKRVGAHKPFVLAIGTALGLEEPYFSPTHPLILQAAPERIGPYLQARRRLSLRRWWRLFGLSPLEYAQRVATPRELLLALLGGNWEVLETDHAHGKGALVRAEGSYRVATAHGWLTPPPGCRGRPSLEGVRRELGLESYHDPLVLERLGAL